MATFYLDNLPPRPLLDRLAPRYPGLEADSLESYLRLLHVASDVLHAVDLQLARLKISQGKLRLLMELNLEPEAALAPSELAERIGVTRATVTGLLDGLERTGFLRRERPPGDRRSLRVRLTSRGRTFVDRLMPDRLRRISGLMAHLTPADRKTLQRLLAKVSRGLPAFRSEAPATAKSAPGPQRP